MRLLTDREALRAAQAEITKGQDSMPEVDREKAKEEMGAWIADYFDDAGYLNWETQCGIYKSMLMSAFPPIDDLDTLKPDFGKMPIDEFDDIVTKFLSVVDTHLAAEQRHLKPDFS